MGGSAGYQFQFLNLVCLIGWLVGWLHGWLIDSLVGRFVVWSDKAR